MKKLILTTALLTMFSSHLASAQDSPRNAPPPAVKRAQQGEAPIGHRQPRASDVPQETGSNDPGKIDAQDRALDRMIKGICKGC